VTKPLAGVRIADFTIHAAGPFATHMLAQLGAECIKIESAARPDILRKPHAVYGRMEPATFDQVSAGKLSVRLNLKHPAGKDLALRLVGVSDVAAESFRPGVMQRLGLAYDDLKSAKPDIVMLSVSSSGQTGPDSRFAGYAPLFGAWGGLGTLTGHIDGPPVEIRHVMDHSVGLNAATATLAALVRHRRTGLGGHVDVAAREVAAAAIGSALVAAATGLETQRIGNGSAAMAPYGVYPSAGDDQWIAVAVTGQSDWRALCELIASELPGGIDRDSDLTERLLRRDAVDRYLGEWTRQRSATDATTLLQGRGLAAHPVWTTADVVSDRHLRERAAIVSVAEPSGRLRPAIGVPVRMSDSDVGLERGTPALGEDEEYVFGELLGLSRRQRTYLEDEGAIS
jgi:crotonobetainyl-CoA:carnitine CoA-transferase CaiB-like acyl-CoA transferase